MDAAIKSVIFHAGFRHGGWIMKHWNILLVDDDQDVLQVQAIFFERMGHSVVMHTCPLKACEYLRHWKKSIDMLVTDYIMPDMNGLELVQAARSNGYEGPVLMISGNLGGMDHSETDRLDMDMMSKPVRYHELEAYMERLQEKISLVESLRLGTA